MDKHPARKDRKPVAKASRWTGKPLRHGSGNIRKTSNGKFTAELYQDRRIHRSTFATLPEARAWIDAREQARRDHGRIISDLNAFATHDAIAARDALKAAGLNASLLDAATFYARHHKAAKEGWTVGECWEHYLARLVDSARERTVSGKRNRLKSFVELHGPRPLVQVTAADVAGWLSSTGAKDRNLRNYQIEVQSLFNFAAKWMPPRGDYTNTVAVFPQEKKKEVPAAEILSPEQARAVLHRLEGHDPRVALAFALGCFAGLRTAEITGGLDWKAVSFAAGTIHVAAHLAKTRDARTVKMPDNLRAWLDKYRKPDGRMAPSASKLHTLNRRARGEIGMDWPPNAARHSCGTYWAVLHGYTAAADQLGHTGGTAMLKRHYQGHVDQDGAQDAARAYFDIYPLPHHGEKIIQHPAARQAAGD